jgi:hypothetical protein
MHSEGAGFELDAVSVVYPYLPDGVLIKDEYNMSTKCRDTHEYKSKIDTWIQLVVHESGSTMCSFWVTVNDREYSERTRSSRHLAPRSRIHQTWQT